MGPWLETIGVITLAILGAALGYLSSRLPKRYWLVGFGGGLALVGMIGACQWFYQSNFVPPFSWVTWGRSEFAVIALSGVMMVMSLVPHITGKRLKVLLLVFVSLFVGNYSIRPFFEPLLVRGELSRLKTVIQQGICIQNTEYTCGPSAAVTALWSLGVKGDEGQIAILAHTCPAGGTSPEPLCQAMQTLYGDRGIWCEYRSFKSVAELKQSCPAVVVIRHTLLLDHFITILKVTDQDVIVGDPLCGEIVWPHAAFQKKWRHAGIVVRRSDSMKP